MTNNVTLFEQTSTGEITLSNHVVIAPLTRNRAEGDGTPKDMAQTY